MTVKNKLLIPFVFLILSVSVLAAGFVSLGVFKNFNFRDLFSFAEVNVEVNDNAYVLNALKADYLHSQGSRNFDSDISSYSVFYDMNRDVSADAADVSSVKSDIYNDFLYLKNFIPDTVFILPSASGRFDGMSDDNGQPFDAFAYALECAGAVNCKVVAVADESMFVDSNGAFYADRIISFISDYEINSLLLSLDDGYFTEFYYSCCSFINDTLAGISEDISFGAEIHTDYENSFIDEYTARVLDERIIDYAFIDMNRATASQDVSFSALAYFCNSVFAEYALPCICEHRLDLIFSNDTDWGYSTEINDQIKVLYNCPSFDGSCFNSVNSLYNKKALARDLSIYINDVSSVFQKNMSVSSISLNNNYVSFTGNAAESAGIYCNDLSVKNNNGSFSFDSVLKTGYNSFDFFCNGAEYSYPVINVTSLIYSSSDVASAYNSGTKELTPAAVCPSGSVVYAVFNGNSYEMTPIASSNVPAGYELYTAVIPLSGIKISVAELSLFCGFENLIQTKSCGTFTNKRFKAVNSNTVTDNNVYTPFCDNGLGSSLMCIINSDNTEQISYRDDYDTYHPYNSSLLKGTVDYVKNINVSPEGYLRYELYSGINVYGTDCILINNGYNLPVNSAVIGAFDDSSSDRTDFVISTDWLIPVTVTQQPLDYAQGYQGFSFNIDSYTCEYVDVTFYYTDALAAEADIIFSEYSVFSGYEIISNGDAQQTVLRLYLKEPGSFFGFDISVDENDDIVLSFKKRTVDSVSGKVIMLDAGHGGLSMVGTALSDNSVSEATVTLAIASRVKKYLEDRGAVVIMTRSADTSLSLSERTYMCETENPDLFVSIHCDGSDSSYESGTHTFYFTPYSQPLAQAIHSNLVKQYTENIYTEVDSNYSKVDRKIKYYPFYVTRVDNCPSVLVETGFLTNHTEGYVLINPAHQDKIAAGIADGITEYFNN